MYTRRSSFAAERYKEGLHPFMYSRPSSEILPRRQTKGSSRGVSGAPSEVGSSPFSSRNMTTRYPELTVRWRLRPHWNQSHVFSFVTWSRSRLYVFAYFTLRTRGFITTGSGEITNKITVGRLNNGEYMVCNTL